MTVIESIFMGLLQGLTEFLPVSSSGHLVLASKLFNVNSNLFFEVMLHVGTLGAVLVAMRRQVWQLVTHPFTKKTTFVIVASVPTFVIAFVVKMFVEETLLNKLLPVGFAITIVLIVLSDKLSKEKTRLDNSSYLPVVVTGVVQGIAVMPGLSRSGSTVSVMKMFGINASDSAEFSFLISVPVILASAVVEGYEALGTQVAIPWYCIVTGIACAFASGLVAVHTVMDAVKNKSWLYFALYLAVPLVLSVVFM